MSHMFLLCNFIRSINSYSLGNHFVVDELPLCNQHTDRNRIALEESPNGDATMEMSLGNANFPFLRGSPFTATLWFGLQGFHMTVNGRHETSFAYREVKNDYTKLVLRWLLLLLLLRCLKTNNISDMQKLEPWLVSEVKVLGGLKLLSASATRLPVPDDHASVAIEEKLKAPSLSGTRIAMLVGVFSTGNNFKRRMALRRSWMQYEAVRSCKVAVRFLIGLVST